MIKVLSFTARMAGASRGEFERYWMDVHVPMWRNIESIRGYAVSTIAADHTRGDVSTIAMGPVDGIVEIWYDDEAAMSRSANSSAGQAWRADSAKFIGGMRSFLTREQAIIPISSSPRPRIKALSMVARPADRSRSDFLQYWSCVHAPIARRVPLLQGFVLSHKLRDLFRTDIATIATDREPDGFTSSYVESLDARKAMVQSAEARHWFTDGASLLGAVRTFVVEEQIVHLPPPASTASA